MAHLHNGRTDQKAKSEIRALGSQYFELRKRRVGRAYRPHETDRIRLEIDEHGEKRPQRPKMTPGHRPQAPGGSPNRRGLVPEALSLGASLFCAASLVARAAIDYTAVLFMHGIALARRLPADSSAPRTADRLQQQLGRRKFVHRGQAADTSLRPEMPIPAPSHQGRLIHKSWSRDYDCGPLLRLPSHCSSCPLVRLPLQGLF